MGLGFWERASLATLRHVHVIPPAPKGRTLFVSERDPAPPDRTRRADESSSAAVHIEYCDAEGFTSARNITIRRIAGAPGYPETLYARCHLRKQSRAFRLDRIKTMICVATGEVLDPVEHCLALHRDGALKIEDKVLTRLMRVMTFVARCDGSFHALEQSQLEESLGRYFRFFGGDDAAYECALTEAPRLAPSGADMMRSLNWLKTAPQRQELARFTINACAGMIDADGRHAPEEINWGIEVSDALKQIAVGK